MKPFILPVSFCKWRRQPQFMPAVGKHENITRRILSHRTYSLMQITNMMHNEFLIFFQFSNPRPNYPTHGSTQSMDNSESLNDWARFGRKVFICDHERPKTKTRNENSKVPVFPVRWSRYKRRNRADNNLTDRVITGSNAIASVRLSVCFQSIFQTD